MVQQHYYFAIGNEKMRRLGRSTLMVVARAKNVRRPHPVSSELELVVSEWRSVIAVSLNVGGGVRLIKPAKLYKCTQTLQTQRGRTHGAGCVRQWFRTAEPLGERRYENWNTHASIILYGKNRKYTKVVEDEFY